VKFATSESSLSRRGWPRFAGRLKEERGQWPMFSLLSKRADEGRRRSEQTVDPQETGNIIGTPIMVPFTTPARIRVPTARLERFGD
jgi:hypothetical protein